MSDHGENPEQDFEGDAGDELTEDELNDDLLLEAMVKKELPARIAFAMCERLEDEPALRERLARIVSSQAVLASIIDPKLRPTTPECDAAQLGFAGYEDGTMPQAEIGRFSAHLQACSLCQLGFEAFQMRAPARADEEDDGADDAAGARDAALEDRLLDALAGKPKPSRWRVAGLSAACLAVGLGLVALGRWGFSGAAASGGAVSQAGAPGAGVLAVARPATSPPDLVAAVNELLAMHAWSAAERAVLEPLADPALGPDARKNAIAIIMLAGVRAPESLAWALAARESSPEIRTSSYMLLKAGGAVIAADAPQALRALDRELLAHEYMAADRALEAVARVASTANVRPVFVDLLRFAAADALPPAMARSIAHRALEAYAGDLEIRAGVEALTRHEDALVRVSALEDLAADADRMGDAAARSGLLLRVAPYLADADPKVAAAARVTVGGYANEADLAAALTSLGSTPPPGWDVICAVVGARARLLTP